MNRFDRQSFLGPNSSELLEQATVGIVGLGGGGSHMAQQSAHIGFGGYVLPDPDYIEDTNTNRLVCGTLEDVRNGISKVGIATRTIRGLIPHARIQPIYGSWRSNLAALRSCNLIMGALDSFSEREQLERFARRALIPYIDIGMDVHDCKEHGYLISGQVILSMPGNPCMRCCGFITDDRLRREAERYGAAGPRPQVVWPNGVLASTAIGLAVQLIAPWHPNVPTFVYLEYDGNRGTLIPSAYMRTVTKSACPHHPVSETGDPSFDISTR